MIGNLARQEGPHSRNGKKYRKNTSRLSVRKIKSCKESGKNKGKNKPVQIINAVADIFHCHE